MIEVKNLVKDYGGYLAVDHLSFRVGDGQIYGLLGPNGAGKPITMSIVTSYLGAIEGQVVINGHDIPEEPETTEKCIGHLPEISPLYMDMTADEYLEFTACIKKLPRPRRMDAMQEVMNLVKITGVRRQLIQNLSKNYQQRMDMTQAILGKPSVIILDEPTAGLGPKRIIKIWDMIKGLSKQYTVILSSHILFEVSAVYDHIMIITHGRLTANDTPENPEQWLRSTAGLDLMVKDSAEALRPVLGGIHGLSIERVEADSEDSARVASLQFVGGEDTINSDSVRFPDLEADTRETIFYALANHRLPILPMAPSEASLEEIFLGLTKGYPEAREDNDAVGPADQPKEEEPQ